MVIKPILFSSPMVRAILEGRKTMTRRVISWDHRAIGFDGRNKLYKMVDELNGKPFFGAGFFKDSDVFEIDGERHVDAVYYKCNWQPGDILWVRETWRMDMVFQTVPQGARAY